MLCIPIYNDDLLLLNGLVDIVHKILIFQSGFSSSG